MSGRETSFSTMASTRLLGQLGAGILQQVLGFGGKADQQRRALTGGVTQAAKVGEDVGVGLQLQIHRAFALDLFRAKPSSRDSRRLRPP